MPKNVNAPIELDHAERRWFVQNLPDTPNWFNGARRKKFEEGDDYGFDGESPETYSVSPTNYNLIPLHIRNGKLKRAKNSMPPKPDENKKAFAQARLNRKVHLITELCTKRDVDIEHITFEGDSMYFHNPEYGITSKPMSIWKYRLEKEIADELMLFKAAVTTANVKAGSVKLRKS